MFSAKLLTKPFSLGKVFQQRSCKFLAIPRLRPFSSTKLSGIINPVDNTVRSPLPECIIPEKNLADFILFSNNSLTSSHVALVDGITGQEIIYEQLMDRTSRLSSGIRRMGLQKGDVINVFSPNSIDYGSIFLGTLAAGGVVSTSNPSYSPHELSYQLKHSNAKYVVTTPPLLECTQEAIKGTNVEKIIITEDGHSSHTNLISLQSLYNDSGSQFTMEPVDSKNDIAVLPYSSGTTGFPKGVMLTHYNVIANCCQLDHFHALNVTSGKTVMGILPFFHIYGMVVILLESMLKGARNVVLPKFEPESFLLSIEKYRIELACLVPPLVVFLSKYEGVSKYDLSSLKRILCGAAPLGKEVVLNAAAQTGLKTIQQTYGLTETSPVTHMTPSEMGMEKPASIALPLPSITCKIVDITTGRSLGPNEEGELLIFGPNVMKGYLNNPDATRQCIDDEGWFSTGDIGYYDEDGHFYITDRLKELIKVKGFQVAPAELEALLLDHPNILDAAVIGVPNERLGEAPKAFVVRTNPELQEKDVQKYIEKNLSEHKWLVGGVEFIEQIPKSASGKILRRRLRN